MHLQWNEAQYYWRLIMPLNWLFIRRVKWKGRKKLPSNLLSIFRTYWMVSISEAILFTHPRALLLIWWQIFEMQQNIIKRERERDIDWGISEQISELTFRLCISDNRYSVQIADSHSIQSETDIKYWNGIVAKSNMNHRMSTHTLTHSHTTSIYTHTLVSKCVTNSEREKERNRVKEIAIT